MVNMPNEDNNGHDLPEEEEETSFAQKAWGCLQIIILFFVSAVVYVFVQGVFGEM